MNTIIRSMSVTLRNLDKLTLGLFIVCVFVFIGYIMYLGVVG